MGTLFCPDMGRHPAKVHDGAATACHHAAQGLAAAQKSAVKDH
jgi:hypothetical protein